MLVKTESGSTYEIDPANKRVRCNNGEWKSYIQISVPTIGEPLVIVWDENLQIRITSPVVEIA